MDCVELADRIWFYLALLLYLMHNNSYIMTLSYKNEINDQMIWWIILGLLIKVLYNFMFNNNSAQIVAQQGYSTRSSTGNIQQQNNPTNIFQSSTNTNQNAGNLFQNNNNQNNNFIQQNIAPQRDSNTYMH
jgi:hypothetical protein